MAKALWRSIRHYLILNHHTSLLSGHVRLACKITETPKYHRMVRQTHTETGRTEWQPWEDTLLRAQVDQHGSCWKKHIQKHLPHRSIQACQTRWQDVLQPNLKRGPFSEEEIKLLRQGYEKYGNQWRRIAAEFLPTRSPRRLANEWTTSADPRLTKGPWTEDEDRLLLRGVDQFGTKAWSKIAAEFLPWRARNQIFQRYRSLNPGYKQRTPWTQEERDLLLRRTIVYGTNRWRKVAEGLPGRSPEACALMWTRQVDPGSNHERWGPEENYLFWARAKVLDNWTAVAEGLPGRSRVDCSNKFREAVRGELSVLFGEEEMKQRVDENKIMWRKRVAGLMCTLLDNRFDVALGTNQALRIMTKQPWRKEELKLIKDSVAAQSENEEAIDWVKVAQKLPQRSPQECKEKHQSMRGIRYGSWTKEEDLKLQEAVQTYGSCWDQVAALVPARSAEQCRSRWRRVLQYQDQTFLHNVRLTNEEKQLIREGVDMFGANWKAVSSLLPGRTPDQCRRWWADRSEEWPGEGGLSYGVGGSGRWTETEDKALRFAVARYPPHKIVWSEVARMIRGRSPQKCRIRWLYCLQPNLTKGRWTYEEEMALIELVQKYQDKTSERTSIWPMVAKELNTGRSSLGCYLKFKYMQRTKGSRLGVFRF
ncbi:hypothetical protein EC973_001254 [Apophysomyces ossiformis]|uniref:Homeodomain-like protein n=1 Tax=Apophysomyces ossiformis TaxID=679940 RepID=A0A8H7BQG5_9FUNG|nr:hypothetical protein EC973_001254 [Apophysomyces ossiformis]